MVFKIMGGGDRWPHLMETLKSVDIRELNTVQTLLLMDLKIGCEFAIKVCSGKQGFGSDKGVLLIAQVRFHLEKAAKAVEVLSSNLTE